MASQSLAKPIVSNKPQNQLLVMFDNLVVILEAIQRGQILSFYMMYISFFYYVTPTKSHLVYEFCVTQMTALNM